MVYSMLKYIIRQTPMDLKYSRFKTGHQPPLGWPELLAKEK